MLVLVLQELKSVLEPIPDWSMSVFKQTHCYQWWLLKLKQLPFFLS